MSPWIAELCSDVQPAAVEWLWPSHLARGKLAALDGDPSMGKSLLTIDLIARLSRGGPLPDGSVVPRPSTSILFSAEDDAADTIRPRAEAAGADLNRLVIPRFNGRIPRLPEDLPALEQLVRDSEADLVVIDPLMAFLPPGVAANLDQCVREALNPLGILAARTGCAVLFVRHLTKNRRERAILNGLGSIGITAAVRTALYVAPHPGEADARVLAVAKTNIGIAPPALGYRIVASPSGLAVIEWTGPVDLSADGLCQGKLSIRDRAVAWLRRELAGGPRKSGDLYTAAAEAGIPERTLERAKTELPALSHRVYDYEERHGEWYWYDPGAPWPKRAPFKRPAEQEPMPWES